MTPVYLTDMLDEQWELLEPLLPAAKMMGRPWSMEFRASVNAIFDIVAGCAWRRLLKDFPKWEALYHYFRLWRLEGLHIEPIKNQGLSG